MKPLAQLAILSLAGSLLAGCRQAQEHSQNQTAAGADVDELMEDFTAGSTSGRYALHTAGSGMILLDTSTGRTWAYSIQGTSNAWVPLGHTNALFRPRKPFHS